jgi:hypothetical protein
MARGHLGDGQLAARAERAALGDDLGLAVDARLRARRGDGRELGERTGLDADAVAEREAFTEQIAPAGEDIDAGPAAALRVLDVDRETSREVIEAGDDAAHLPDRVTGRAAGGIRDPDRVRCGIRILNLLDRERAEDRGAGGSAATDRQDRESDDRKHCFPHVAPHLVDRESPIPEP